MDMGLSEIDGKIVEFFPSNKARYRVRMPCSLKNILGGKPLEQRSYRLSSLWQGAVP